MKDCRILLGGVSLLILIVLTVLSCSEDDHTVTGGMTGDYQLTAQVLGYECSWPRNPYGDHRYTVTTGGRARASVYREGVLIGREFADDSSFIRLPLDSGVYDIILESDHTYPDTFRNVTIEQDSFRYFEIIYSFWRPEVCFLYHYDYIGDSLGYQKEWLYITELTGELADMFDLKYFEREVNFYGIFDSSLYVYYWIPVTERYFPWFAFEEISEVYDLGRDRFADISISMAFLICPTKD